MPKRTAEVRVADSQKWHRTRIRLAYESGELEAPLQAAVRFLYAALAQAARDLSPADAAKLYDHVTHEITKQATSAGARVPTVA